MSKLFAGFSCVDISPEESVPLAGFGRTSSRMSQGVLDPLHACCLAVTDESGSTALVIVMDLPNMYQPLPGMREDVSRATGLPLERIMFCCTHTHSAPHLSNDDEPTIPRYCDMLRSRLVQGAQEALADRKECTLSVGAAQTKSLNFVRRYVLEDGTYAGDNYGHFKESPIAGHESEPDRTIQVIKFTREGGHDLILANFQGHPHRAAKPNYYMATSDLVYYFRKTVEEETGCHVLYYTGSSGNVNCHSRVPEENIYPDYVAHGKALAGYALKALQSLRPVENGLVRNVQLIYEGRCNHTEDHKLEIAKIVVERWKGGMKSKEAREGYEHLINSPYHAQSIITKAGRPETADVELNGFAFGDVAMVFAPFELFSDLGVAIKENSPFAMTFVCCYANRIFSYMPTQLGFDHGGYGPNQCRFEPGTGEILVEKFGQILNDLKV